MSTLFNVPLPASLTRRLAEAADGFRNVNQVFLIAGYEFPHPIKDFPDLTSAQSYFSDNGFSENEYGIFGPFKTNDDVENLNLKGVENIESIDLTIHFKDGSHQDECLTGSIDSIFFNLSSFEKFVFPYYCRLYGVEYAKTMRENLIIKYSQQTNQGSSVVVAAAAPPSSHSNKTLMLKLMSGEQLPKDEITY